MSVRTDQLARGQRNTVGAGSTLLYTAPLAITPIVKDIVVNLPAGVGSSADVVLTMVGGVSVVLVHVAPLVGVVAIGHFVGFVALEPGDTLLFTTTLVAAQVATVVVSGAELAGLAP